MCGCVGSVSIGPTNTATHIIAVSKTVGGVVSLGDELFVVSEHSRHVEVYDTLTYTLQRHILVPGFGSLSSLSVCRINNCLYMLSVSGIFGDRVHRVELTDGAVLDWSVARRPTGLSVNSANNVLVVSPSERKMQEFTTRGTRLREIQLPAEIERPWQALQLPSGQFLVSNDASHNQVALLTQNGTFLHAYEGDSSSDGKMSEPRDMTIDEHGNVLVADKGNNRLLALDQSLTGARVVSVSVDGGLRGPRSLWYDMSRKRLCIGEVEGGRVIVIDNIRLSKHSSL